MQQASGLLAIDKVSSRLLELHQQASDIRRDRLDIIRETLLRYHGAILETPVVEVDANHWLAQEVSDTEQGRCVKMPSKLEAAKQLATLTGWNAPEKQELKHGVSHELREILRAVWMRRQSGAAM